MVTYDRGGDFADKAYVCKPNRFVKFGMFVSKMKKENLMFELALKKKD